MRPLMALLAVSLVAAAPAPALDIPQPVLRFLGAEPYTAGGKNWVRYRFQVENRDLFPAAMFAAAPDLPPCGTNTNASRSWVDFFTQQGKRLYGFCAIGNPADLDKIWFAVEEGRVPPSWVYIEINDRRLHVTYRSNLAETSL